MSNVIHKESEEMAVGRLKYPSVLASIYRPQALLKLVTDGISSEFLNLLSTSGLTSTLPRNTTVHEAFEAGFDRLFSEYRNEYIYKNIIATNVFLGRHLINSSSMLPEFRIGKSKIDVAIFNGTSTGYEIKSELDSLDRLSDQFKDYLLFFDKMYVVTHSNHLKALERVLPHRVGLMLLKDKGSLSVVREAVSNAENTDPSVIFDSLRMGEYKSIIKKEYGEIPNVPNTLIFKECKKLFTQMAPTKAHSHAVTALRQRSLKKALVQDFKWVPKSLIFTWTVSNLKESDRLTLSHTFNQALHS